MKLKSIEIEGFKKHYSTKILCEDTTFLIGAINPGKGSILNALLYFLSLIHTCRCRRFSLLSPLSSSLHCLQPLH
ncbi:AAA family ATPase [Staphylococcus shinii]|uniref:AAA family ATPase n=1 Tax=Staphylococcus shinii TaxID=2912228 RepID=UPI000E6A363A|nr:AAA family ATPase [Staphylococcus shinii]RIM87523.1 hypothetical protein BU113_14600 [Staphylococcus shinii]